MGLVGVTGGKKEKWKDDDEEVWSYRVTLKVTNKGKTPVIYYITDHRQTNIGVISNNDYDPPKKEKKIEQYPPWMNQPQNMMRKKKPDPTDTRQLHIDVIQDTNAYEVKTIP